MPVPPGFNASAPVRKSFTLAPVHCVSEQGLAGTSLSSIGVLWSTDGMYVNDVKISQLEGLVVRANKKNGMSLSVKKLGGWKKTYDFAVELAGWKAVA